MARLYKHTGHCRVCDKDFEYVSGNPDAVRTYCDSCHPNPERLKECSEIHTLCKRCGQEFTYLRTYSSNGVRKYCEACKIELHRERAYNSRLRRGLIKNPGVGSGNAQGNGVQNHNYTNGYGIYRKLAMEHIPPEQWKCMYCGATYSQSRKHPSKKMPLLIHHKDGNRRNNDPSNWEIVCKRCHQVLLHKCEQNLPQNLTVCGCKTAELNGEASIGGNPSPKAGVISSQAQRLEADA